MKSTDDLDEVGRGLDTAIGNAFDANYDAPTDMLTITEPAGVQVAWTITPATVDGSAAVSGTKAYVTGVTIALGSDGTVNVPQDQTWSVTINGTTYSARSKGSSGESVDQMGQDLQKAIDQPHGYPTATYDSTLHKIAIVAGPANTVFTLQYSITTVTPTLEM